MAKKQSKQKKMATRVDCTPMVDMMMLLITFFMLCTSLAKPQSMELSMPSNDKNIEDKDRSVTKESYTITVYVAGNDKLYYVKGQIKYDDPTCMVETTWGKKGIREVFQKHVTEDNTQPVLSILKAKQALDERRDNEALPDSVYQAELSKLKKGELPSGKIETMTVVIKALDTATYKNVVDILDEMQICAIGTYVLDQIKPEDQKLLDLKGVK